MPDDKTPFCRPCYNFHKYKIVIQICFTYDTMTYVKSV